jgi:hypothetical protein
MKHMPRACHNQQSNPATKPGSLRCWKTPCRQKVPQVASAERMEVMHRLHAFLLRQADIPEGPVLLEQPTQDCTNSARSNQSQQNQSAHPATVQQGTRAPAQNGVHAQSQVSGYLPTIQACMKLIDRLIVLAFTVLAILIAWNVIRKV